MKNQSAIKILFSKRITRHLVFWFLYLLVSTLIYGQPEKNFLQQFKWHLFYMPVVMGAVYFTIYYLLPEFLLKKKYIQFIIYLALSSLFFSFLQRANVYFIVIPFFNQSGDFYYPLFSFDVLFRIIKIYSVVTIAVAAKLVYIWYLNQQIREELEKEKLKSELKALKNQIHPHFLFNTLNNLYVLTKKKSDMAPGLLLKLSDILRYMIYELKSDFVPVENELKLLENYMALERIRYGEDAEIIFNVEGSFSGFRIAPMLLLPFVENAFKHGFGSKIDDRKIDIRLLFFEDSLNFRVKNNKDHVDNKGINPGGEGLKNVKKRLDILYKKNYSLKISNTDKEYEIELRLINAPDED